MNITKQIYRRVELSDIEYLLLKEAMQTVAEAETGTFNDAECAMIDEAFYEILTGFVSEDCKYWKDLNEHECCVLNDALTQLYDIWHDATIDDISDAGAFASLADDMVTGASLAMVACMLLNFKKKFEYDLNDIQWRYRQ